MSEGVITDADIEAASEWAHQLAEKIVFGNHGSGNAAVLFDRAFEARATAAEAREAKLREALDRLIAYYDPLGHLWGNGCHHGFKPASMCQNEGCEERELHRALQALETDNATAADAIEAQQDKEPT